MPNNLFSNKNDGGAADGEMTSFVIGNSISDNYNKNDNKSSSAADAVASSPSSPSSPPSLLVRKFTAQQVNIFLNVLVIVGLVAAIILAGVVLTESDKSARLMGDTLKLAQELRVSSDDLTRFIRTYTVTGNVSYWKYFNEVLDIRDGKVPLPSEPWRMWWDSYIGDARFPRGVLPPSSIVERMEAAGFTDYEMSLFNLAKANSDALVDLESIASAAMEGWYRPTNTTGLTPEEAMAFSVRAAPNATFAMGLVHGVAYHSAKAQIMKPIDEFTVAAYNRVQKNIDDNFKLSIAVICLLAIMLALLITLLLIYFCKIAGDSQTAALLNTMLPDRVVESVTVDDFQQLRKAATYRISSMSILRPNKKRSNKSVVINDAAKVIVESRHHQPSSADVFPVLYSEFLPMAWVAFTDVVNFTAMCRYTPAKKVISVLNELFSLLDVEALNYKVEKIKTIGDAFMCAKLTTSERHAPVDETTRIRRISDDGFQMLCYLTKAIRVCRNVARPAPKTAHAAVASSASAANLVSGGVSASGGNAESFDTSSHLNNNHTNATHLEIRAGLHVGPVASGIVGFERPLYDLFGDTVNTAARLEANGRANRVQVMETTLQYLDDHVMSLEFESEICQVQLKGIGTSTTRFIKGVKNDPLQVGGGCDTWSEHTDTATAVTSSQHMMMGTTTAAANSPLKSTNMSAGGGGGKRRQSVGTIISGNGSVNFRPSSQHVSTATTTIPNDHVGSGGGVLLRSHGGDPSPLPISTHHHHHGNNNNTVVVTASTAVIDADAIIVPSGVVMSPEGMAAVEMGVANNVTVWSLDEHADEMHTLFNSVRHSGAAGGSGGSGVGGGGGDGDADDNENENEDDTMAFSSPSFRLGASGVTLACPSGTVPSITEESAK